jgi:hypothetical protein
MASRISRQVIDQRARHWSRHLPRAFARLELERIGAHHAAVLSAFRCVAPARSYRNTLELPFWNFLCFQCRTPVRQSDWRFPSYLKKTRTGRLAILSSSHAQNVHSGTQAHRTPNKRVSGILHRGRVYIHSSEGPALTAPAILSAGLRKA